LAGSPPVGRRIAKVLFVLFLIGAVISLVLGRPWA